MVENKVNCELVWNEPTMDELLQDEVPYNTMWRVLSFCYPNGMECHICILPQGAGKNPYAHVKVFHDMGPSSTQAANVVKDLERRISTRFGLPKLTDQSIPFPSRPTREELVDFLHYVDSQVKEMDPTSFLRMREIDYIMEPGKARSFQSAHPERYFIR